MARLRTQWNRHPILFAAAMSIVLLLFDAIILIYIADYNFEFATSIADMLMNICMLLWSTIYIFAFRQALRNIAQSQQQSSFRKYLIYAGIVICIYLLWGNILILCGV